MFYKINLSFDNRVWYRGLDSRSVVEQNPCVWWFWGNWSTPHTVWPKLLNAWFFKISIFMCVFCNRQTLVKVINFQDFWRFEKTLCLYKDQVRSFVKMWPCYDSTQTVSLSACCPIFLWNRILKGTMWNLATSQLFKHKRCSHGASILNVSILTVSMLTFHPFQYEMMSNYRGVCTDFALLIQYRLCQRSSCYRG